MPDSAALLASPRASYRVRPMSAVNCAEIKLSPLEFALQESVSPLGPCFAGAHNPDEPVR